jgi:hypothetical protein
MTRDSGNPFSEQVMLRQTPGEQRDRTEPITI